MEAHREDGPDRSILPNTSVERVDEVLRHCHSIQGHPLLHEMCHGYAGSETALEELMCRVLGDLVEGGHVVKIADDLPQKDGGVPFGQRD